MDSLSALQAFVSVAEVRSFTAAARQLRVSSSAIGKAVSRLEDRHGVRLFNRSTRTVSLTREGQFFLDSCRRIISEIANVEKEFTQVKRAPKGRLRVSLPLLNGALATNLRKFRGEYPDIELEIDIDDGLVDVIDGGFDLIVRTGDIEDSRLMTRSIASYHLELVASPDYLGRACRPQKLDELANHTCLYLKDPISGKVQRWPLVDDEFADATFPVGAIVSSTEALVTLAARGMGIACVPDYAVRQHLAEGTLCRVLVGSVRYEGCLKAVWPSSRYPSPKLRAFIDFMAQHGLSNGEVVKPREVPQTAAHLVPRTLKKTSAASLLAVG